MGLGYYIERDARAGRPIPIGSLWISVYILWIINNVNAKNTDRENKYRYFTG
jgi:hypothetical protein